MGIPSFHIRDIPEDGMTVDVAIDTATMRGLLEGSEYAPADESCGSAHVQIDRHERAVTLTGSVDATLRASCVRCLEPIDVKAHADFTLYLTPAASAKPHRANEEIELSADELDQDHYVDDRIELAPWLREQILLEAPTFPECPNGCAAPIKMPAIVVQTEHKVDPRLAPLQKFSKKR